MSWTISSTALGERRLNIADVALDAELLGNILYSTGMTMGPKPRVPSSRSWRFS